MEQAAVIVKGLDKQRNEKGFRLPKAWHILPKMEIPFGQSTSGYVDNSRSYLITGIFFIRHRPLISTSCLQTVLNALDLDYDRHPIQFDFISVLNASAIRSISAFYR